MSQFVNTKARNAYRSGAFEIILVFSGIRVAQSEISL
jgi:hypothetical protein